MSETSAGTARVLHEERLRAPLSWWLLAGLLSLAVAWSFLLATPPWFAGMCGFVTLALVGGGLWSFGSVRVAVVTADGRAGLVAGRARLPLQHAGIPQALDPVQARRRMGPDADVRAFLVTRPYLHRAVLIPVEDTRDPTPYWLVASRSPEQLVAALRTAGGTPDRLTPPPGAVSTDLEEGVGVARRDESNKREKPKKQSKRLWKMYGKSASVIAAIASTQVVNLTWQAALRRKPPASPENPEVTMREAVVWAVISGSAAQVARIVATRRAVDYWVRSTGQLPPGIKSSQLSSGKAAKTGISASPH